MSLILFLIVGVITGLMANLLFDHQRLGFKVDVILGSIGAYLGNLLYGNNFKTQVPSTQMEHLLSLPIGSALMGACAFLILVSLFMESPETSKKTHPVFHRRYK